MRFILLLLAGLTAALASPAVTGCGASRTSSMGPDGETGTGDELRGACLFGRIGRGGGAGVEQDVRIQENLSAHGSRRAPEVSWRGGW